MAKVRKKYSKFKRMGMMADHLLKDILVCYADRLEGCVMYHRKKHYIIKPSQAVVASCDLPHQWSCLIAALGRNQFDEYMKSNILVTKNKHRQSDLAPIFEDEHLKLMKTIPEPQLCGVAWIADPFGGDISEKEAGTILSKLGAWG